VLVAIGLILVVIMLFSTMGYGFLNKRGTEDNGKNLKVIKYNGVEFKKNGLGWEFEIENKKFLTKYNPQETENISLPFIVSLQNYHNKPLYFVSKNSEAVREIGRNLNNFISRNPQYACLEKQECDKEDLPVKNCTNDNIIIIKESRETSNYKQDNCIFIEGEYEENIKVADALLFKILEI